MIDVPMTEASILRQRIKLAAVSRVGIFTLLGVSTLISFRDSPRAPTPTLLLWTVVVVLFASVLTLLTSTDSRILRLVAALQGLMDLAFATVIVYLTGGAESAFSILFHLSVIVAAFVYGKRGALLSALGAAALFCSISFALQGNVIGPPLDLAVTPRIENRELWNYLGSNLFGLVIIASAAGYLADLERRAGGKLAEARKATADLAALNEDILRSLTIGLAATDDSDEMLWINPAGFMILQTESEETARTLLLQLIGEPSLSTSESEQGEGTIQLDADTEKVISYRIAPLLDGEKNRRGKLLVFQDLTELRLMQERVQRSERLAALGKLATGLAHELRNPLGSVSGSLQLLQESEDIDEQDSRLVDIMLRELDRLADLVTQMLDLARPRSPHPLPLDIPLLVDEVTTVIGASAEAEELEFDVDLPSKLHLEVDPDMMRQMLWNLLRNATQASEPGSTIFIHGAVEEDRVVLDIDDAGAGITEEDRGHVFEPFYSTKQGGIGMGLAICRQVAESHGGRLTVHDSPEGGARFRLELPRSSVVSPQKKSGPTGARAS